MSLGTNEFLSYQNNYSLFIITIILFACTISMTWDCYSDYFLSAWVGSYTQNLSDSKLCKPESARLWVECYGILSLLSNYFSRFDVEFLSEKTEQCMFFPGALYCALGRKLLRKCRRPRFWHHEEENDEWICEIFITACNLVWQWNITTLNKKFKDL